MTNKDIVLRFYEQVFNAWDLSRLDEFMHDDYIQHNPEVKDGKQGFIEFCQGFFTGKPRMQIIKIAQEQDYVFVFLNA